MGCSQSKIENEETVNRCKERKYFLQSAVTSRNKFASAHSSHAVSLKNTGAALSDFAHGESPTSGGQSPPHPPYGETFIAPPPPLPPSFSSPLQRAATMPEFSIPPPPINHHAVIEEENEDDVEDNYALKMPSKDQNGKNVLSGHKGSTSWDNFYTPMDNVVTEKSVPEEVVENVEVPKVAKQDEGKRSGGGGFNLVKVFDELDNCFLMASESAHDVSRMLEAARLHYHSNFADKRGNINHSERVMRVITWNRSFKGLGPVDDGMDGFDSEEEETHATVLDKMLAWEKKLYEEVKAGEQMKLEYQRKVASLNKLKKRNSNTEAMERTKASVSHLHTRYIVDMQSMDSTVSEINRLRDEQLYPKLVALVDGMAEMWKTMRNHHETQSKIVQVIRLLDSSQSPKETSDHHHIQTRQLGGVVQDWHSNFSELMSQQKEYIKALNSWLKLNLIPIDTNWKEKVSSPSRPQTPPIQILILAWQDHLEKIPDEPAKATINNFATMIKTIWQYQKEELEHRDRVSDSRKDLIRKTRDFEMWHSKFMQKKTPPDEMDPDQITDKDAITERHMPVEAAKQKLEEDEEAYQRQCVQTREKTLMNLKSHLPELFRSLTEFSLACSEMYSNLSAIARSRNRNDVR